MAENKKNLTTNGSREFNENPYDPENKRPEDIVRLFYVNNVPIIPVVSKKGILIGILKKDDVISELSDIERVEKQKIDRFITKLAKKMSFDDLLPYGKIKEFIVINIFGEVQGNWSRLKIFTASESTDGGKVSKDETEKQKEDQVLEWMIYLILEYIPRPLYAINKKGKTIFYNGFFEEIYNKTFKSEVDTAFVEESIKSADKNELISSKDSDELWFYNKDIKVYYEKIPLISKRKKVGYLIFCNKDSGETGGLKFSGIDIRGMSFVEIVNALERQIIVDAIKSNKDIDTIAKSFKISKRSFINKIEKHGIDLKNNLKK